MDVEEKAPELESNQSSDTTDFNIGALLIEARENQNLSAEDIANQLNLTAAVVNKIESNEFEQDIPLAFIRGYVRSYGQKVGMDIETLCAEFDRQTQQNEEPIQSIKRISPFGHKRTEINSSNLVFKVITYVIVGMLLAFGGWEVWKRVSPKFSSNESEVEQLTPSDNTGTVPLDFAASSESQEPISEHGQIEESESEQTDQVMESQENDSAQQPLSSDSESDTGLIVDSNIVEESPQQSEDVSPRTFETANNESNSSDSTLSPSLEETENVLIAEPVIEATFTFTDDCWVSVTDANGEVLAIGVKKSGKVMPLKGVAPWNVILGEPSVVSLDFKNEAYDLSGYRPGRRAKFVLE